MYNNKKAAAKRRLPMKKFQLALLLLLCAFFTGCASFSALPITNDMDNIKGMTKQAIVQRYGEPSEKSSDSNTWDYKKPSDNKYNKLQKYGTFGIYPSESLPFVDITRIKFHGGKVVSTEYIKETINVTRNQVGIISGFLGENREKQLLQHTPKEMQEKINLPESEPHASPKKTSAPTVSESTRAEKEVVIKQSMHYSSCTLKTVRANLCSHAKRLGMRVEEKGNSVVFVTPKGERITTNFQKKNKNVLVELTTTQQGAADDIQQILEN